MTVIDVPHSATSAEALLGQFNAALKYADKKKVLSDLRRNFPESLIIGEMKTTLQRDFPENMLFDSEQRLG